MPQSHAKAHSSRGPRRPVCPMPKPGISASAHLRSWTRSSHQSGTAERGRADPMKR